MFGSLDGKTIGTNPTSARMNRASRIKNGKLHVWISPAKTQNPLFRKNHEQSTKHVDDSASQHREQTRKMWEIQEAITVVWPTTARVIIHKTWIKYPAQFNALWNWMAGIQRFPHLAGKQIIAQRDFLLRFMLGFHRSFIMLVPEMPSEFEVWISFPEKKCLFIVGSRWQ